MTPDYLTPFFFLTSSSHSSNAVHLKATPSPGTLQVIQGTHPRSLQSQSTMQLGWPVHQPIRGHAPMI